MDQRDMERDMSPCQGYTKREMKHERRWDHEIDGGGV